MPDINDVKKKLNVIVEELIPESMQNDKKETISFSKTSERAFSISYANGIMTINDDADIADYVNKKATCSSNSDKRAADLISDFTYYGHGFPNKMAIGYRTIFNFSEEK